ncbi:hypothetical protein ABZT51_42350 [Streptomyces sp. NPDC005373]|uniref:hypothetical protein n=1 Tax=Streptomyces sp. NPDC005373 TaxID=3156879 RepID=UPI0033A1AF50
MSALDPGQQVPTFLQWSPGHPPPGDPIDMEYILDKLEPNVRNKLIAARLETVAAVHQAISEGAKTAATIIAGANG